MFERLERPVVQAGMGGGLAGAELAGAVSAAGGLGTAGMLTDADAFAREIGRARDAPGRGPGAELTDGATSVAGGTPFRKRGRTTIRGARGPCR